MVQSADGGDELFAGYDKYRKIINRNKKSKFIPKILKKIFKDIKLKKVQFDIFVLDFKNEVDWFIDDIAVHDDFELRNLLKFPKFFFNLTNKGINLSAKNP